MYEGQGKEILQIDTKVIVILWWCVICHVNKQQNLVLNNNVKVRIGNSAIDGETIKNNDKNLWIVRT